MPYDVVVKGGHVLDPGQGLDAQLDIAVQDGKIVAIQPDIPTTGATRVVDVRGASRYVLPGLLDIHTHVAHGATTAGVGMGCVDPDVGGVGSGATTLLDAGSVGIANIGVFGTHLLPTRQNKGASSSSTSAPTRTPPPPPQTSPAWKTSTARPSPAASRPIPA